MPLGTEVDLGPGHVVLDGDPAVYGKGTAAPPTFRLMTVVAKRSPISATVELLFERIAAAVWNSLPVDDLHSS